MRLIPCLLSAALLAPAIAGDPPPPAWMPPGKRGDKAIGGGPVRFFDTKSDQAAVATASFLGGKGTEWLVAGGFQPDGTIVLAGNVLGSAFDLGKPATVIGSDGKAPPATIDLPKDAKGNPGKPSWTMPESTGFIARVSADGRTLLSVARLPWGAGAITACAVDATGAIYIAGRSGEAVAKLGGAQETLKPADGSDRKGGACDATFVAKLSKDGATCEWLRASAGKSDAPRLSLTRNGSLCYAAQDVRTFDPAGKQLTLAVIPGGVREETSVSPVDGTIVKGGEHHWGTGREPWRCPTLTTFKPDGTQQYQLYDWGGPYVGLDNCRQVSDSAVRQVVHDRDGNIFFVAWSDGGNSVITSPPMDVRRGVGVRGLGWTSAGAGVLSCCYLVKLEPKDYQVVGWTMWLTFYKGKPNSIGVDALGQADDGSFCIAGGSAWGLVQTPNRLGDGEPAGKYVAVLNQDLSSVRFCSAIAGAGAAQIGNDANDDWGVGSGTVNGKAKALYLTGAIAERDVYGLTTRTPTKDGLQSSFAGGACDGWFMVLDLGDAKPANSAPIATPPPFVKRLTIQSAGWRKEASKKDDKNPPAAPPADGQGFLFSATNPKYISCDLEVRDTEGLHWPNFLSGRPATGKLTWQGGRPGGSFTIDLPTWCQPRGDQSRRVLGKFIATPGEPPKVSFALTSLGSEKSEDWAEKDAKGNETSKTVTYFEGEGTLTIGDRTFPVKPRTTVKLNTGGRDGMTLPLRVSSYFTLSGKDLGVAAKEVDFRVSAIGVTSDAPPPKGKK